MELFKVNDNEYKSYFNKTYHTFNSVEFSELNKNKVDELLYLLFKDTKIRLGIVLGKRGNFLFSPFSAPFGGFSFLKEDVSIETIDNSIKLLQEYSVYNNLSIKISLPPNFYSNDFISKCIFSFLRSNFKILYCDFRVFF